jgi:hypothetical protein
MKDQCATKKKQFGGQRRKKRRRETGEGKMEDLSKDYLCQSFCIVQSQLELQVPLGTDHIVTTELIPLPK